MVVMPELYFLPQVTGLNDHQNAQAPGVFPQNIACQRIVLLWAVLLFS